MKTLAAVVAGLVVLFSFSRAGFAQDRSPAELDQMLGPIALYPDPLVADILSAATFPSQIVEADRYASGGGDPSQIEQQPWDPSVQALAHYPNVLKWLDDNLAWTTQLGQAFASQQADVMASIQRLRAQAQGLGNLPSTAQETVMSDDGDIEIEPADPDDIYVPDYSPGAIYYQPGVYCTFGVGMPMGGWFIYDWDWRSHRVVTWGPGHPRPDGWWHETPVQRHDYISQNHTPAWRPARVAAAGRVGGDRGYAPEVVSRSVPAPVVPRTPARNIAAAREQTQPAYRAPSTELPRSFAPAAPAPAERAGAFGGFQDGASARESSARGQQSHAVMSSGARGGGFSNKR